MKKTLHSFILNLCLGTLLISGFCGCTSKSPQNTAEIGKLKITAAIFPAWDWTRNILGENPSNAELTLLLDNGVDLHSYQPSVEDILKIAESDLFIYVGGESDQWVTDALRQANNPDMRVIRMIDAIGDAAREEEITEGMQSEPEEDEEGDEIEYDEHVWLSLRNAERICDEITRVLSELDPQHAALYQENSRKYTEQLQALDEAYAQAVRESDLSILLFGDRFPFRYLTEDYGLDYYAAFSGCSAETEASFETIAFLAQKIDELSLPAVLTIDGTEHRIAETIVQSTKDKNQKLLVLNSMQSITSEDVSKGKTYLSVMEDNLDILKQSLKKTEN